MERGQTKTNEPSKSRPPWPPRPRWPRVSDREDADKKGLRKTQTGWSLERGIGRRKENSFDYEIEFGGKVLFPNKKQTRRIQM